MSDMNITQLLNQMRVLTEQAKSKPIVEESSGSQPFSDVLKSSISQANTVMNESTQLKESFDKGDPNVSLAQVMIADQKSSVAFQTVLQVRNRFIDAYNDIMNMPM